MSETILEVQHLGKSFGNNEILKDIDFSVKPKDVTCIIGPSGSGKSTLLRCMNLLETPSCGEIRYHGTNIMDKHVNVPEYRSKVGMVFQNFNLFNNMTVLKNCTVGQEKVLKKSKEEAHRNAMMYLEKVGMAPYINAKPKQLSGGQKQRVAIARALATDPKILLCDEATSALDPQTTQSILALLKEINRKFGITIVIITHQMSVIREICSHVAIVEKGSIVEVGLVEEIFNHPKSRVARSLILSDRAADAASYSGAEGDTADGAELTGWSGESRQRDRIGDDKKLRIVFSENSAFEPVIANMVLKFGTPVNILRADTKNVGGVAKGEMILGLPSDAGLQEQMEAYLVEKGLEIEEVTGDVE